MLLEHDLTKIISNQSILVNIIQTKQKNIKKFEKFTKKACIFLRLILKFI